jgi:arginyl-tRNA synthetase
MKQHLETLIRLAITQLQTQGEIGRDLDYSIHIERAKNVQHGDYACNIAMTLAKATAYKPRELAKLIVENLPKSDVINTVSIAGPGFINFSLNSHAFTRIIPEILQLKEDFGQSNAGNQQKVNVEFVSANPTGPLHVGHGRGAAYGAALADLLAAVNFAVCREYYVNDAGRQMDILAVSVWLRYLETLNCTFTFPKSGYKGDYIKAIAKGLHARYQNKFSVDIAALYFNLPPDESDDGQGDKEQHIDALIARAKALLGEANYQSIFQQGLNDILGDIKEDLADFGVHYQTWFSERSLKESHMIEHAIETLRKSGHLYERDGALWFHSIPFGDDKDRVLVRENGQATYFASDIAYLLHKHERGFDQLIYILGADHHGYIARLKAAAAAMGINPERLHIQLVQFAILYRGTERVQMSTRSGSFVTLRELREEIGNDAARFFYVTRKSEQHMDFDLNLAKSQSADNPVYYIQYAHARICSVFRQLTEKGWVFDPDVGTTVLDKLADPHEKSLLADLARFPEMILQAARAYEPHQIANYLRDLANDLHTYYNACQFLTEDEELRNARLCLIMATRQVLFNGLKLLGVSAPEAM